MIIKQTTYGMQDLFENFRKYSILTEEQLLIEGRIDDVKKKYPELAEKREGLDGESVLDVLIQADPSGNQKYLAQAAKILNNQFAIHKRNGLEPFWEKKWPLDSVDGEVVTNFDTEKLWSPWGLATTIATEINKFHELLPHIDPKGRDLASYKTWEELNSVVSNADKKKQDKDKAKKQKEQESEAASSTSRVIVNHEDYIMIRPESEEASCYYGKGTKWCISATESTNYYEQYTADGKSFYFVILGHLSNDNKYKKLAMVVDIDGVYDETFDAEDNSLSPVEITHALVSSLLHEKEADGALMTYLFYEGDRHVDDPTDKDEAEYLAALERLGIVWDPALADTGEGFATEALNANEIIREKANAVFKQMKDWAEEDAQENPAGPSEEAYRSLNAKYDDRQHINVSVDFPYETGASQPTFTASAFIDLGSIVEGNTEGLEWKVDLENLTEEEEATIYKSVQLALRDAGIFWEDLEADDLASDEFLVTFESGYGSPEAYDHYLRTMTRYDSLITDNFDEQVLGYLSSDKWKIIGRTGREEEYWPDAEEKKKQMELPLQENKKGQNKMKLTKETLKQLIREEVAKLYE
jgi:hypothetical protein